ncbi:sensor histidine kinase [Tenacibaculum sp. 190524A05c]|uniref:His_kinase domain-containing protein n=1 Tax=Tenacibaculum platacis TaxID=3137852 RepID=A0ABM9P106_9FLAO
MKKHILIITIGILLGFLVGYYMLVSEQNANVDSLVLLGSSMLGVLVAYLNYFISIFLDKVMPWKIYEGSRLFTGVISHFILSLCIVLLGFYIYSSINSEVSFFTTYKLTNIKLGILLFLISIVFQVVYFVLYSYYSYSILQIETVKLERNQVEHQLNALKSQISPHFLFNGLNTASSLIHKDENKASLFIRKLAQMYANVLKSYSNKLTTLNKELELVESYNFLISNRFGNKYSCEILIDDEILNTKIPPLALEMLVENAVKHNVLSEESPLKVKITNDDQFIYVENNITSTPKKVASLQIGLKNINTRYVLLTGKGVVITNGNRFLVKLPIIR